MKFKLYYTFVLLFYTIILFAQQKNIYIEYTNKQISQKETTAFLVADDNNAIYEEKQSKDETSKEIKGDNEGKSVVLIPDVKPNKFYKAKNSSIIYYNEYIIKEDNPYSVYDSLPKINWELIPNKTDTLKGYVCNIAKLKFRGSNITAYYTLQIPISFGPWKFDGLPGMILKVSDDDNPDKTYWEATKIIYPYKERIDFLHNKNDYKLSLKDFKILSYKIYEDRNKTYNNKHGQGSIITNPKVEKRPFVVEKIYEWEKKGDVWGFYVDYYKKKLSR